MDAGGTAPAGESVGRAALNVLARCQPDEACPAIFASRYGDLDAIAGLLDQLYKEGTVSPMGFSLSVHNAAMGVYSIARVDRATTTSIAANLDLAEAACFEALGWLAAGAPQVLVVCCADPVLLLIQLPGRRRLSVTPGPAGCALLPKVA